MGQEDDALAQQSVETVPAQSPKSRFRFRQCGRWQRFVALSTDRQGEQAPRVPTRLRASPCPAGRDDGPVRVAPLRSIANDRRAIPGEPTSKNVRSRPPRRQRTNRPSGSERFLDRAEAAADRLPRPGKPARKAKAGRKTGIVSPESTGDLCRARPQATQAPPCGRNPAAGVTSRLRCARAAGPTTTRSACRKRQADLGGTRHRPPHIDNQLTRPRCHVQPAGPGAAATRARAVTPRTSGAGSDR